MTLFIGSPLSQEGLDSHKDISRPCILTSKVSLSFLLPAPLKQPSESCALFLLQATFSRLQWISVAFVICPSSSKVNGSKDCMQRQLEMWHSCRWSKLQPGFFLGDSAYRVALPLCSKYQHIYLHVRPYSYVQYMLNVCMHVGG